jgi:hypothetical protein
MAADGNDDSATYAPIRKPSLAEDIHIFLKHFIVHPKVDNAALKAHSNLTSYCRSLSARRLHDSVALHMRSALLQQRQQRPAGRPQL